MSLMTYCFKQMIIQDDNFVDLNKLLINKVSSDSMKISYPVINSKILKLINSVYMVRIALQSTALYY
jgi:hypothetical protein